MNHTLGPVTVTRSGHSPAAHEAMAGAVEGVASATACGTSLERAVSMTYLLRHAESTYSTVFKLNGNPSVPVPLSEAGEQACAATRSMVPVNEIESCIASPFPRCVRTAELLLENRVPVVAEPLLGELDYGAFEGESFVEYARWLAANGPMAVPPWARESQLAGIGRLMHGLQAVLTYPSPRIVVTHGLLLSVIQHTLYSPGVPLRDVFLLAAAPLTVVALSDDQLRTVTAERLDDLAQCGDNPAWVVDLRVFPSELRGQIATLDA